MSVNSSLKMHISNRSAQLLLGLFITITMGMSACSNSVPKSAEPSPQSTTTTSAESETSVPEPVRSISSTPSAELETQTEGKQSFPQSAESEPTTSQSNPQSADSSKSDSTKQFNSGTAETAPVAAKRVKVFFPKRPELEEDFTYVEPVWRTTTNQGVAQFAVLQLISGPTNQEKRRGLINPIEFKGTSNCGRDFTLAINQGAATLKFCRQVISGGTGDDARTKSAINATLKQFSTINSVIILDKNGDCLGDQSGENPCLQQAQVPAQLTEQSKVAINGIGPVDIGMTVTQASRAAGVKIIPSDSNSNPVCDYYQPQKGLKGVSFMVSNGRIARVDINSNRIATVSGARVGDSEARVRLLYSDQLKVSRLANSETGKLLTFIPKSQRDKNLRLNFTTDGQRVTGISTGKLPEASYIEGCLDVQPG